MNDYGIPIMEPSVDYTKVLPIRQKRTITFVNHFLVHTVTYLNKFALFCEEKLFEFENKLQKVEASLDILESRLSSIPEADLSSERDDKPVNWEATNEAGLDPLGLDNPDHTVPKKDAVDPHGITTNTNE